MNKHVYLIEELVDYMKGLYSTVAAYSNREAAENWIIKSGGNQEVLLNNGNAAPEYRISFFVINDVCDYTEEHL